MDCILPPAQKLGDNNNIYLRKCGDIALRCYNHIRFFSVLRPCPYTFLNYKIEKEFMASSNSYLSLNRAYSIRNESNCSYLVRVDSIRGTNEPHFGNIEIPPFMGYIFSNISKYNENEVFIKLSEELCVSPDSIKNFVAQLVDNPNPRQFKLNDISSITLPVKMLIRTTTTKPAKYYSANDFNPLDSFNPHRASFPTSANLMITNSCTTDCIYCYANRNLNPALSLEQIKNIITQLNNGGCVNLSITGGDIFARKDFLQILEYVSTNGFKPFLSTKTPLEEDIIIKIRELGYDYFQFSLDSCNPSSLTKLLKVKGNYINRVKKMLNACNKLGINIGIRSVITAINGSPEEIKSLYEFILNFKCITNWDITPYFFSPYKRDSYYENKPGNDILKFIYSFSKEAKKHIPIILNKINENGFVLQRYHTTCEFVNNNTVCVGNCSSISILSNGLCSVCEMLYDNETFVLGDAKVESIYNIWNSVKALNIYHPSQDDAPSDSPCSKCEDFYNCRQTFGKRVCYNDIAKVGGSLFSPDPHCPLAKRTDLIL